MHSRYETEFLKKSDLENEFIITKKVRSDPPTPPSSVHINPLVERM